MKRRGLFPAALFTVALIAGFAWFGEKTHAAAPVPARTDTDVVVRPMPLVEPDPRPEPATASETPRTQPVATAPRLSDTLPVNPPPTALTQPMEPPPLPGARDTAIPTGVTDFGPASAVFNPSDLDQAPQPRSQARPVYPSDLKREGISGEVLVDFIVDAGGNVRNAFAVRAPNREFEDAACAAVSRWTFRPGRKDGRAVAVHMQVPIVFSLGPEGP